jgi:hypothetical protein
MSVRDLFEAEKVRGHRRDGGVKIDSGGFKHYIKNYIYRETDRGGVFGQNAARRYLRVRRYSASRPPEARGRACAQVAGASHASCRSGPLYKGMGTPFVCQPCRYGSVFALFLGRRRFLCQLPLWFYVLLAVAPFHTDVWRVLCQLPL